MKYLCAIMAFLVLTLSVQPVCVASDVSGQDCCHDRNCAEQGSSEEQEDHECAQCNPFQLCSCCAFSVVPVLQLFICFSEKPDYNELIWGISIYPDIDEPVLGFWQPPKIIA
ncbi:MAG TPA: hypothetical protein VL092_13590 [Chitinophagaceae bacterium]|nr:hypothetical protein [Chitinophagaceae bacterium]